MYKERRDGFTIKDIVLQFLFIALFVFILIWLFPLKSDFDKAIEKLNTNQQEATYDNVFNNNILMMKDAAKSYYTTSRLPQNIDEKVSMTLGQMLDNKIILPFTDSKGKECDKEKSYIEITRLDNEYVLKVNLKCSEEENYLLVYMGCYEYCTTAICEKNKSDIKSPVVIPQTPTTSRPTSNNNKDESKTPNIKEEDKDTETDKDNSTNPSEPLVPDTPTKPEEEPRDYLYEYSKYRYAKYKYFKVTSATYSSWSSWSDWSEKKVQSNSLTEVETKTQTKTTTTYKEEKVLVGYKVTTTNDLSKPIYEDQKVVIATKEEKYCKAYGTTYVGTGKYTYGSWILKEKGKTFSTTPTNTDTTLYVPVSSQTSVCKEKCTVKNYGVYNVYTRTKTEIKTAQYGCTSYGTKTVNVYGTKKVLVGYEQKTEKKEVYATKKTPITTTSTVTLYRYRTRTLKSGETIYKWSNSKNDETLIKEGYKYMNIVSIKWSTFINDAALIKEGYSYTGEKISKWSTSKNDEALIKEGYAATGSKK